MGRLQKKLFGQWRSNATTQRPVLTPSSDLSSGRLTPSSQLHRPVEIAGQPISPASSSLLSTESLLSDRHGASLPFELQRTTSTLVPELAFSNGRISPSSVNNRHYYKTMAGNHAHGYQNSSFGNHGYAHAGYSQQSFGGQDTPSVSSQKELCSFPNNRNVACFASEQEFSRDEELQVRRLENRFGPQQQQQQQAIVKRKSEVTQKLGTQKAQETPNTHPSTSTLNLSFNGRPLLESISSFSTTQQIFVLVFILTLTSVMFFAVLTSVFSFLRESTMYILAAFALGFGGYGFLTWSRMKAHEEMTKVKIQADMEQSKAWRTEMERDKEMMKQLQWDQEGLGLGYKKDIKRLEDGPSSTQSRRGSRPKAARSAFSFQKANYGGQKQMDPGWSRMEVEEVE